MKDFGYDISDFRDVDPLFGTLDDFRNLLDAVHERGKQGRTQVVSALLFNTGMKLVMDFIPNHSRH